MCCGISDTSIEHNGTVVCMLCSKSSTSLKKLAPTGLHGLHVFATLGSGGGSHSYDDLDEEEDDDLSHDDDDPMEHNDLSDDDDETGSSPHDRETNGSGEGRNTQRKGRAPSQALK